MSNVLYLPLPYFQALLRSLRYSYSNGDEELPGVRQITISASDGVFTDSTLLLVTVRILNDNAPVITFGGSDTAVFMEGSQDPLPIGMR